MVRKVGIITFHKALNYGAVLQTYALQTMLEQMECEPIVLDYDNPYISTKLSQPQLRDYHNPLNFSKDLRRFRMDASKAEKISSFATEHLHVSSRMDKTGLKDFAETLDIVVTGSDQVWNDKITHCDDTYYLDFAPSTKRVSYAASIGSEEIPLSSVSRIYPILREYRAISVRETQAQHAINRQLGLDVQRVLDPTLVLCADDYAQLTSHTLESKYVLVYMLFYSEMLLKKAKEMAAKLGCSVYCINASGTQVKGVIDHSNAGIEEWLSLMKDAEYVFTNSFHGVAFSVNFGKQFAAELPPARIQAGSRITDLLSILNLIDRIMTADHFDNKVIDYNVVNCRLNAERAQSQDFLKSAILQEMTVKGKEVDRSIISLDQTLCSGCGYCALACPAHAIGMKEDDNGFMRPVVAPQMCINCGKCAAHCPTITEKREVVHPQVYAAVSKNEEALKRSSSGGAFFALAEQILSGNGAVYGAAFNEDFVLEHRRITDIAQIKPLMGSKYLQSNAYKVFPRVIQDLSEGMPVLFVGTPCQVAALRELAGDKYSKLFLVDFVCHGVPSPVLIRDHIKYVENYFRKKVVRYQPRSKMHATGHNELFVFEDSKCDLRHPVTQAYKFIFYSSSSIRQSCSHCAFSNFARPGDLTIADFWGIERSHPELQSPNGVSMVLVNTDKGHSLLSEISTMKMVEVSQLDIHMDKQPHLFRPIGIDPVKADLFWSEYHRYGWKYIAEKYAACGPKSLLKWKIKQTKIYQVMKGKR